MEIHPFLIGLSIFFHVIAIYYLNKFADSNNELEKQLRDMRREKEQAETDLAKKLLKIQKEKEELTEKELLWLQNQQKIKDSLISEIDTCFLEKEKAYRWAASITADLKIQAHEAMRNGNETIKTRRNSDSQAKVTVLLNEKRELNIENSMLKYQLE